MLRQLFEREYPKCEKALFLVALSYLHNSEDARDVLQDSLLSALQNIHSLRHPEYFKTWLTRIVINKSKNFLKAKRYTEELTDKLDVFYRLPEQDIEILDAICRMDRESSVYISLRFYNGMNYQQAAKALKQPVSTVKYRTAKALKELKRLLEGDA